MGRYRGWGSGLSCGRLRPSRRARARTQLEHAVAQAPRVLSLTQRSIMATAQRVTRKKIYLIQPQFPPSYWGQEHFIKMTPYGAAPPPLGLLTLPALTPPEYDVTLCDESAGEKIDHDTDAEI